MRCYHSILYIIFLSTYLPLNGQPKTDAIFQQIFAGDTNPVLEQVVQHSDMYRLQIIYTQINRDRNNHPTLKNYYFHYYPKAYLNPASMVKLPLAFLALEKLNALQRKDVDKYTTILLDSSQIWHRPLYKDTTASSGLPTIAHFIKRAFLVSENDPYNRLYQFLGQSLINQNLHQKGYPDIRITRQFMGLTEAQNRHTPAIRFVNSTGKTVFHQPPALNTDSFHFSSVIKLGKAHYNLRDSLVNEPFDFTRHNNLSLESMQQLLQSVLFPQSVPVRRRFNLTPDDYAFLYRYLSQYPSETNEPKYDTEKFYDSYVKFFFRDSTRRMPEQVRVFNKVGWSYGFLTDVSYIDDFKNHAEFMLAATLYVNSDEILNDGKYEYNNIGYPFLYALGQTIYQFELKRKKPFPPDLSAFKLLYEKRDPNDKKPSLGEVDN